MYIRILVLILVLNPAYLPAMWWRLTMLAFIGVALSFGAKSGEEGIDESALPNLHNPFEIRPAVVFGLLFVILTIATELIQQGMGSTGVLALSAVVGVTDIDPFILTLINPSGGQGQIVARAIIVAMLSNVVAKGIYFAVLAPGVRRETAWKYAVLAVCHVPLLFIP
jgi:uncharacterized membrane protein (DUF4010 family)